MRKLTITAATLTLAGSAGHRPTILRGRSRAWAESDSVHGEVSRSHWFGCREALDQFLARIEPLGVKFGPILPCGRPGASLCRAG